MSEMKAPAMEVVRFENEDVIATSVNPSVTLGGFVDGNEGNAWIAINNGTPAGLSGANAGNLANSLVPGAAATVIRFHRSGYWITLQDLVDGFDEDDNSFSNTNGTYSRGADSDEAGLPIYNFIKQ